MKCQVQQMPLRLITHFSDWTTLKVAVACFLKLKKFPIQQSQTRKEIKASLDSLGVLPSSKKMEKELQKLTFSTITQNLTLEDLTEAETAIGSCLSRWFFKS